MCSLYVRRTADACDSSRMSRGAQSRAIFKRSGKADEAPTCHKTMNTAVKIAVRREWAQPFPKIVDRLRPKKSCARAGLDQVAGKEDFLSGEQVSNVLEIAECD